MVEYFGIKNKRNFAYAFLICKWTNIKLQYLPDSIILIIVHQVNKKYPATQIRSNIIYSVQILPINHLTSTISNS